MGSCVSSSAAKPSAPATNGVAEPRPGGGRKTGGKRGEEKRGREGGRRRNPYEWSSGTVANVSGGGSGGGDDGGSGEEALLHRLEERMFLNGASDVACLHTQQGRKGTNQDAMLVWENFPLSDDAIFCGVFDGHGPYGHMVAKRVRDSLPLKLCNQWKDIISENNNPHKSDTVGGSVNSEETSSIIVDEDWIEPGDAHHDVKLPEMYLTLRQSLLKSFMLMDKELKVNATVDCFCSGTTAVTLVKQGQDLIIANVGDSRAVLGTRDKDNSLIAVQLTVDLKPNLPREAARIEQCRGRVFALQDEPEVARVWLPNNDSPGLAMARAFGDFCLKDYGLISVPDISYRCLTDKDEFIVLATDGVWDVFSNKEVVDMVASSPTRGMAARALVDCAGRAWRVKFPTSKSDDCAVICLFLNRSAESDLDHENSSSEIAKETEETSALSSIQREIHPPKVHPSASDTHLPNKSSFENLDGPVGYGEIEQITETKIEKVPERSSARSLADCISTADDEEWSALEGVTRVNSLLNLPRFLSGDKKSASWRKWL